MNSYSNTAELFLNLKKKEAEITELLKIKQKYEIEYSSLHEKYLEKSYRLKSIEEDYKKLKEKFKQLNSVCGNSKEIDLPSEVLKYKEECRKTKELLRQTRIEYEEKIAQLTDDLESQAEKSEKKLGKVLSEQTNNEELLEQNFQLSRQVTESIQRIEKLEEDLLKFNEEISILKQENAILIEENINLEKKAADITIVNIKKEIDVIYKQVSGLLNAIESGKESQNILQMFSKKQQQEEDIFKELSNIKLFLNQIKSLVVQYHAELTSEEMCSPQ